MAAEPVAAWDLSHHGDIEATAGLVDLAVNVRHAPRPPWLAAALTAAIADLSAYPNQDAARAAVAARHARPVDEVLLTAGAAEAFVLLARVLRPDHAVVVHPQFTEPEAALRAAGHHVDRVLVPPPFALDPAAVPASADLVVVGNPTNPTSVLHPAAALEQLARPGRTLVVDEAFADCVPGETESLATRRDLPGLAVVRSLTKTWALAGLRCGYVLGAPALLAGLAAAQPLWPLSTPALAACEVCSSADAVAEAAVAATRLRADRDFLVARLAGIPGVHVVPEPAGSFVLFRHGGDDRVRLRLRDKGFATRRCDTFPGLDASWLRVAVRDRAVSKAFAAALEATVREQVEASR